MSEYADRDIMELDKRGNYYCRHVSAMTAEKLHAKSDIAAELGYRDMLLKQLREENKALREALAELIQHTPRTVTRYDHFGGSYQVLTGTALLAVIDKCEELLK